MSGQESPKPVRRDWTDGPAKWLAVVVLGAASITGMVWSMKTRTVRAHGPSVGQAAGAEGAGNNAEGGVPPTLTALAHKINLNTASEDELELLPGVGPGLAARIVEYRTAHGGFRSVDELDNVTGIGPRIMEKVRPLVTLE